METLPEDQKVIELLTKLKRSNNGYPSDMLAARRQMYIKQLGNVGLGLGAGAVLKNAAKGNGAGATTTVASKILEITLIAAIAIEAGTVTYLYRGQIAETIRGFIDPTPTMAAQPDANNVIPETIGDLQTPLVDASETSTNLPSLTPGPVFTGDENPAGNLSNTNEVSVNATPAPGNQGNQYGLTPKPDRTKENEGRNDENSGNGGNDNNIGGSGNNNNGRGNDN